jgi:hypothetical protein
MDVVTPVKLLIMNQSMKNMVLLGAANDCALLKGCLL